MTGLAPLLADLPAALLDSPAELHGLVAEFGSPVNVVFPDVFTANVDAFRDVLRERGLEHRICYAHKVNRARAFVDAALRAGIDVDIASAGELGQALAAGFPPSRIEATGPKGEAFLQRLLTYAGLTVNVDNPWELSLLAQAGLRVPVLLRMSGGRRVSRFGLSPDDFPAAFDLIAAHETLQLRGISFHLDTADPAEKVEALRAALALIEQAYARGLTPRVLDIGGGFRQRYLADSAGFDAYVKELRDGLAGRGRTMAWGGQTFGYRLERDGSVRGTPVFHRYTGTEAGADLLAELLDQPLDGQTVAQVLRDNLLELWIEPGKALADHAGLTVATVQFVKRASDGSLLVNLDLSRDDVTPADQEVMLDPVLVPRTALEKAPCEVYLAGNLCLERDMISNHLVRLPALPSPGDLLVFANTAAYQMDLSASAALMHPRLPKVVAIRRGGRFHWFRDGSDTCSTTASPN